MKISVIIPVYNAEKYIEEAVNSALIQPECAEIILIEDGSTDRSHIICDSLAQKHTTVKVLRHSNGKNRGAGASRNVGIINSQYDIISFLDADDFYTPNRFTKACELLQHRDIDGVYGATGIYYENKQDRDDWLYKRGPSSELTTIKEHISPRDLFKHLLLHTYGHFTTDAITVRRRIFSKTGLFDEHLLLHQDTAMWLKMAATGILIGCDLNKPMAIRRVHTNNRINKIADKDSLSKKLFNNTILEWAEKNRLPNEQISLIKYRIWKNTFYNYSYYTYTKRKFRKQGRKLTSFYKIKYFSKRILRNPNLLNPIMIVRFLFELSHEIKRRSMVKKNKTK